MIIVPTHKRQKSPYRHSKTIYIFTYGRVIVSVQIHSRKKILKGVKMTTAKWTINTGVQQDLRYHVARFSEKGCWQVWAWICPYPASMEANIFMQVSCGHMRDDKYIPS